MGGTQTQPVKRGAICHGFLANWARTVGPRGLNCPPPKSGQLAPRTQVSGAQFAKNHARWNIKYNANMTVHMEISDLTILHIYDACIFIHFCIIFNLYLIVAHLMISVLVFGYIQILNRFSNINQIQQCTIIREVQRFQHLTKKQALMLARY